MIYRTFSKKINAFCRVLVTQSGFPIDSLYGEDNYVISRGTGVIDKCGQPIFEGDILEWDEEFDKDCYPDTGEETFKKHGVVEFVRGCFTCEKDDNLYGFSMNSINGQNNFVKVVGNIYQNQEFKL